MKKYKNITKIYIIYLILFVIIYQFLIHNINADSISYLSISKKYASFNFKEAINTCWSPFYSWLIVPSFWIGIEPHLFARLLNLLFSLFTLVIVERFFIKLNLNEKHRLYALAFFILPLVFFTYYRLTPDYLLLLLTLIYVYISIKKDYLENTKHTLLAGLVGSVMFLTKTYGMMFFIIFQTIILITKIFTDKYFSKKALINYAISLIIFFILISPWVYLITQKNGTFTFSTASTITMRLVNPQLNFNQPNPGFVKPSDRLAVSYWDEPNLKNYPEWSPFDNFSNFKHFLFNILRNIIKLLIFIFAFYPLMVPFALLIIKRDFRNDSSIKIFTAALIYGLGYTTFYVENRYIWVTYILLLILSLLFVDKLIVEKMKNKILIILFVVFSILSFVPFMIYGFNQQLPSNSAYHKANLIKENFGVSGNIASNYNWEYTLALSYFLDSKFYGTEKLSINNPELYEKAKNLGIDYIFDYSDEIIQTKNFEFIGKVDSIRIFKVIKR